MPNYSLGRLLAIVCVICVGSLTMHAFVFSKKPELHYKHFDPKDAERARNPVPAPTPVEGVISALGIDRIHLLDPSSQRRVFRCEAPGQFKIGQKVRVTYADGPSGEAPLALKVEPL